MLVDVSSTGSFPYRAKVDDRVLHGELEFNLFQKIELATGALRESDLTLTGGLETRAGPVKVKISVHKLHVHVTEVSHEIVDVSQIERADDDPSGGNGEGEKDDQEAPAAAETPVATLSTGTMASRRSGLLVA